MDLLNPNFLWSIGAILALFLILLAQRYIKRKIDTSIPIRYGHKDLSTTESKQLLRFIKVIFWLIITDAFVIPFVTGCQFILFGGRSQVATVCFYSGIIARKYDNTFLWILTVAIGIAGYKYLFSKNSQ